MYIRLMSLGYTMEDIATVALETQKIRMQRAETLQKCNRKWGMDKFNIIAEVAKRKLFSKLKLIGGGKNNNIGSSSSIGTNNNNNNISNNKKTIKSSTSSASTSPSIKIASYASRSA